MHLALCDDEDIYLTDLSAKCTNDPLVDSVDTFHSPKELIRALSQGAVYHAILMDIDYGPDQNGIESMDKIARRLPDIPVIYVTNYTDRFVEQVFLGKANLLGFLKKPVQPEMLHSFLEKCQAFNKQKQANTLSFSLGKGEFQTVLLADIVFLEIADHSTRIHTVEKEFVVHEKLDELQKRLTDSFTKIHKSYLINMDMVKHIQLQSVELNHCDEPLPISRAYRPIFKPHYLKYMQSKL